MPVFGDAFAAESAAPAPGATMTVAQPDNPEDAPPPEAGMGMSFVPLVLIFFIMYFLLIRPQQKRLKQHQDLVAALKKGDRIVTGGGIIGTITKFEGDDVAVVEI